MTAVRTSARPPFFYCATLENGDTALLTGAEANHVKAQRLQPDDVLVLFDGKGGTAEGRVQSIGRREIAISVTARRRETPPTPRIDLYCAVPKGERIAVLLDMATQLGMSRFTPVRWTRSVVEPGPRTQDRWQRVCLEACKQSRRARTPEIGPALNLESAISEARASGAQLVAAHPNDDTKTTSPMTANALRIALFVGPEGGMVVDELRILRDADADFLSLGDGILRIETAAVALIAVIGAMKNSKEK